MDDKVTPQNINNEIPNSVRKNTMDCKNLYVYEVRVKNVQLFDEVLLGKLKAAKEFEYKVKKQSEMRKLMVEKEHEEEKFYEKELEEKGENEDLSQELEDFRDLFDKNWDSDDNSSKINKRKMDFIEEPKPYLAFNSRKVSDYDRKMANFVSMRENIRVNVEDVQEPPPYEFSPTIKTFCNDMFRAKSKKDEHIKLEAEKSIDLELLETFEDNFDFISSRLKVIIPLYDIDEPLEIGQHQFVDEIDKEIESLIAKGTLIDEPKPMEKRNTISSIILENLRAGREIKPEIFEQSPDEPIYIDEFRNKSLNVTRIITTPNTFLNHIRAGPIWIKVAIERLLAPQLLYGKCRLRFDQKFIDAITKGATSYKRRPVVHRVKMPIINKDDEQIGLLWLFLKLTCCGCYEPNFPTVSVHKLPLLNEFDRCLLGMPRSKK